SRSCPARTLQQHQQNSGARAGDVARNEIEARVLLFWNHELRAIESMPPELSAFKNAELPLARIKKIMKLDDDVKGMMIAAEAPLLFSKAAEIFIRELTIRAWAHTERARRRTLQRNDIAMSVGDPDTDQFDFLIDIVPREEMRPAGQTETGKQAAQGAAVSAADHQQQQAVQLSQDAVQEAAVAAPVQYVIQLPVSAAGGPAVSANGQQQAVQIFFNSSEEAAAAGILTSAGQELPQDSQQLQQLEEPQAAAAVDSDALVMDVKPVIAQQPEDAEAGGFAAAVEAAAADSQVAAADVPDAAAVPVDPVDAAVSAAEEAPPTAASTGIAEEAAAAETVAAAAPAAESASPAAAAETGDTAA
uniref:CBFD_NFYB_HMF domain-containing protein n=2 Tax=Macrostomum lignano TaxID=282301 RepID=A0A1I8GAN5_9PLAT